MFQPRRCLGAQALGLKAKVPPPFSTSCTTGAPQVPLEGEDSSGCEGAAWAAV